jgi:hypothetical protein
MILLGIDVYTPSMKMMRTMIGLFSDDPTRSRCLYALDEDDAYYDRIVLG